MSGTNTPPPTPESVYGSSGAANSTANVLNNALNTALSPVRALEQQVQSFTDNQLLARANFLRQSGSAQTTQAGLGTDTGEGRDMRVRLSAMLGREDAIYGPAAGSSTVVPGQDGAASAEMSLGENVMAILHDTRGMVFPYTPSVTFAQEVSYNPIPLTHTNYDIEAYQRTPSVTLQIAGKFTVQNKREGIYALACLHFLRSASKMHFGKTDPNAGLPPPVLMLNGYGTYMFNNLKVILKNHSFSYAENMDTVDIQTAGGTARLPALFDLSITVTVQQTPQAMRDKFNLEAFRNGRLIRDGGWI